MIDLFFPRLCLFCDCKIHKGFCCACCAKAFQLLRPKDPRHITLFQRSYVIETTYRYLQREQAPFLSRSLAAFCTIAIDDLNLEFVELKTEDKALKQTCLLWNRQVKIKNKSFLLNYEKQETKNSQITLI